MWSRSANAIGCPLHRLVRSRRLSVLRGLQHELHFDGIEREFDANVRRAILANPH